MDTKFVWDIIDKHFEENPQSLVRHHLESFNDFYKHGIFKLFKEKNPITIVSKYDESIGEYRSKCNMYIGGKNGDKVYVSKAYGNFGHSLQSSIETLEQKTPIVLIAGGIGIAPMVSLLKQLTLTHHTINHPIHLIYGNRIENQIIDLSTLIDLHAFKQLTITHIISEPSSSWKGLTGILDQIMLKEVLNKTTRSEEHTSELQSH